MTTHLSFNKHVKIYTTLLGLCRCWYAFGIVASFQNFSILEIVLLCLVIYAGAAQFIMCALFIAGTPIFISDCTNCISRKFKNVAFLSMSLAPNFRAYGFWNVLD
ncbi:AzlC family ABC transporter permease [Staphylococcus aureus]